MWHSKTLHHEFKQDLSLRFLSQLQNQTFSFLEVSHISKPPTYERHIMRKPSEEVRAWPMQAYNYTGLNQHINKNAFWYNIQTSKLTTQAPHVLDHSFCPWLDKSTTNPFSLKRGKKSIVACFGFIWQIMSNRWLIRFKTFVSQSTTKLYN
jgi:hypothetical protein